MSSGSLRAPGKKKQKPNVFLSKVFKIMESTIAIKRDTNNKRRKGIRKNNQQRMARRHLSNIVNLYSAGTGVTVTVNLPAVIYAYQATTDYSFQNASDARFFPFSVITAGSTPFINYLSVFSEYKITMASAIVSRCVVNDSTFTLGRLYLTCDPEETIPSNPSKNIVTESANAHYFSPRMLEVREVDYRFPGIGASKNVWNDVDVPPPGSFYIGSAFVNSIGSTIPFWEVVFSLVVQFRNLKSH